MDKIGNLRKYHRFAEPSRSVGRRKITEKISLNLVLLRERCKWLFQWFWMSETNNILTCGWWKIQNGQVNDELQLNVPSRKVCAIKSRNWFIHLSDIGRIERTVRLDLKKFFLKAGSFLYSYVFLFSSRVNELDVDEIEDSSMEWMSYQKRALVWIIRKIL